MTSYTTSALIACGSAALTSVVCLLRRRRRKRVLVTGFHDWHGIAGNVWRYENNPTAKFLLGWTNDDDGDDEPHTQVTGRYSGALAILLQNERSDVDWHFLTLPVVWNTANSIDYASYDIVINMGLDTSVPPKHVHLEDGAYNKRSVADGIGFAPPTDVCDTHELKGAVLYNKAVGEVIADVCETTFDGGMTCARAVARPENTYICNETNWTGLQSSVEYNYFAHVPQVTTEDDYYGMSDTMFTVITRLVDASKVATWV